MYPNDDYNKNNNGSQAPQDQFNDPNQYNPNRYNPNQYNPNQYNPNQYNQNPYNNPMAPDAQLHIKAAKKTFNSVELRLFFGSVVFVGVELLVSLLVHLFCPEITENPNLMLLFSTLPNYLISLPFLIILLHFTKEKTVVVKKNMRWYQLIVLFLISYSGLFLGNIIGTVITTIVGAFKGTPVTNNLQALITDVNPLLVVFVTVICAPIYEEIIFRKLIISNTIRFGEFPAILLSAIAFGLYHGNISQTLYATVIGFVLGYVFVRTGRILYTIILHMCINFMGSVVAIFILKYVPLNEITELASSGDYSDISRIYEEHLGGILLYYAYVGFILLIVVAGIVAFCLNLKKIFFLPTEKMLPKGTAFKTVAGNVGFVIFALFWTGMIIVQLFWG